jgi:hypothetical protein
MSPSLSASFEAFLSENHLSDDPQRVAEGGAPVHHPLFIPAARPPRAGRDRDRGGPDYEPD